MRWTGRPAVLLGLVLGGLAAVPPTVSAAPTAIVGPVGSFESHVDGFKGVGKTRLGRSSLGIGRNGSRAMSVRTLANGPAIATNQWPLGAAHSAGTTYTVRAWVRVNQKRRVAMRVSEVSRGRVVRTALTRPVLKARTWTPLNLKVTSAASGSTLTLKFQAGMRTTDRYFVDDLRITAPVKAPVDQPSGDPAGGMLTNKCSHTVRGIPSCGTYVGAAHGSNTEPSTFEGNLGGQLGVRRTYFTATGVAKAVSTARADLAAGRLPWISFKLPHSWADMVAGKGDAWARDLAKQLSALDGPVWVAFHHEPEGDGDIQLWRRMQERLAPIVRSAAPNVAFTVVMTGWNQFYGEAKYSLAEIWPRGVEIDVAGFDIYQNYGVVKDGKTTTKWTDFEQYFRMISTWARTAGVDWALGETGVTQAAIAARPTSIADTVKLMQSYGGIGYSYFDTTLNSVADWSLSTTAKVNAFKSALSSSPKLD
ncbi:hypothetical protein ASE01_00380 [Nocardioides sp. Root190]|uniref:cellulase family glycosylhydrolase n=1 Tax=Nocardioides sp. Root190 TaxID=1736488 RepID=UPI0006FA47EB|nr:cellulase family glycosylhydrolase [Nocardioides sp. Root190]KRB80003.1 hypothetical protein ASE01_00380 [Nocardioides sp. Root190]